jgi:hypothetical protein
MYVVLVAATTLAQSAPCVSQRRHWYRNVIGVDPDHVPGVAVSTCPG